MTMKRIEDFGVSDNGAFLPAEDGIRYRLFVDHKGRLHARKAYQSYVKDGYWITVDHKNGSPSRNMTRWEIFLFNWFAIIPEH